MKNLLAIVSLLCLFVANANAGATVNWWVMNNAKEPVKMSIWKTTRVMKPGERASFPYAVHSKLWVNVRKMDDTLTYSKKHSFDWVPNNHACTVNPDFTFTDHGKDINGQLVEKLMKAAGKAGAKLIGL